MEIEEIRPSLDRMIVGAIVRDTLDVLEEAKNLMEDLWYTDETMRWKEHADKWPQLARLLDQAIETLKEAP